MALDQPQVDPSDMASTRAAQRAGEKNHSRVVGTAPPCSRGRLRKNPTTAEPHDQAHRQIHEERRPPAERGDQHGAEGGSGCDSQGADSPPQGDDLRPALFGIRLQQQAEGRGQEGRRSDPLQQPPSDQDLHARGEAAHRRTCAEGREPPEEDPSPTQPVSGTSGDDEQCTEHDAVPGDHPGELDRGSWGNDFSRAGKATLTMERSSEAMKAPRAVTTNTPAAGAPHAPSVLPYARPTEFGHETEATFVRSIMQLSMLDGVELKSFAGMDCSVAQCLEIVGGQMEPPRPSRLLPRVRRFDDFQRRLGILRKHPPAKAFQACGQRDPLEDSLLRASARYEYRLTEKGRDLWPVITTMREWGDRYAAPDGPPIEMLHKGCGNVVTTQLVCSGCGGALHAREVSAVAGPGRDPRS